MTDKVYWVILASKAFWEELTKNVDKLPPAIIDLYAVNRYYKYPYGKSNRGMKKLVKKLRKEGRL